MNMTLDERQEHPVLLAQGNTQVDYLLKHLIR
jgi:hypothetical protein